jgi:hypothetical protein
MLDIAGCRDAICSEFHDNNVVGAEVTVEHPFNGTGWHTCNMPKQELFRRFWVRISAWKRQF